MFRSPFKVLVARRSCILAILIFFLVVKTLVRGRVTVSIKEDGDDRGCLPQLNNNNNNSNGTACRTLKYALTTVAARSGVDFLVGCGQHALDGEVSLTNCSNFSIKSSCSSGETTIACTNTGSLAFHHSANITISNITFKNCGPGESVRPGWSGLLFNHSRSIRLEGVDSTRGSLSYLDTYGTNTISSLRVQGTRGGPGLYIELGRGLCSSAGVAGSPSTSCDRTEYSIRGSMFQNCRSTECSSSGASCRGGGVGVVFRGSAANIAVNVESSSILGNEAGLAGGGAFVAFLDQSSYNRVTFSGCDITNNSVSRGSSTAESTPQESPCQEWATGGGVAALYSDSSAHNAMKICDCSLSNNSANAGGGLAATFNGLVFNSTFKVARSNLFGNRATRVVDVGQSCNERVNASHSSGSGGGLAVTFAQKSTKNLFTLFASTLSYNYYSGNGGGLSLVHSDNSTFNEISSSFNTFESNFMPQVASECSASSTQSTGQDYNISAEGGGLSIRYIGSTEGNAASLWDLSVGNTANIGGGMFIGFEDETSNNNVRVSGVVQENKLEGGSPRTRSGGGIMIEYSPTQSTKKSDNRVVLSNALIVQNNCENSFGGGAAIFQEGATMNTIGQVTVSDCVFANNSCSYGRSMAALSSSQLNTGLSIELYLRGRNLFLGMLEPVVTKEISSISDAIKNVSEFSVSNGLFNETKVLESFEETIANLISETLPGNAESPTHSFSIPPELLRNGQSSIYLRSMVVHVGGTQSIRCGGLSQGIFSIDSQLTFDNTTDFSIAQCAATDGGAVALYGFSTLTVAPGSNLTFTANRALQRGGAVYVRTSPGDVSIANTCFLRYTDPTLHPENWTGVNLAFVNNTASTEGSSIYIREGLTCLPSDLRRPLNEERLRVLKWDNIFTFSSPDCDETAGNCSKPHVTSGPHTFETEGTVLATTSITISDAGFGQSQPEFPVIPGQLTSLPITAVKDIYNQIIAPTLVHSIYQQPVYNISVVEFSNLKIRIRGTLPEQSDKDNHSVSDFQLPQLIIQSLAIRELFVVFPVRLQQCPPSFIMIDGICRCNTQDKTTPYLQSCDDMDNLAATLRRQTWLGYVDDQLAYADCPVGYCTGGEAVSLVNATSENLDTLLCSTQSRTGILCGACKPGLGIPINTNVISPECVSCDNDMSQFGILIWFAAEWLPIIVVMIFILLFNVDLFDGRFNSFLLFAQIVPGELIRGIQSTFMYVNRPTNQLGFQTVQSTLYLYNFLNLNFFSQFLPKFCITRSANLSILHISLLQYLIGILPLLLIMFIVAIEVVSNKCCRPVRACLHYLRKFKYKYFNSPSYDRAITTFYILGYTRFITSSVAILHAEYIYSIPDHANVRTVLYLDGTILYLSVQHYEALIPAIFVIITLVVVPTLFLIIYPTVPLIFEAMKKSRYKALNWVEKLTIVETAMHRIGSQKWIKHYLEVCQGCFSYKYRIFASFFFLYRIIVLGFRQYLGDQQDLDFFQAVLLLTLFTAVAVFQPYEKAAHNIIDTIILGVLTLLFGMNLYLSSGEPGKAQYFQVVLIMLMLFYPLAIFTISVFRFYKRFYMHRRKRYAANNDNDDDSNATRLTGYHSAESFVDERHDEERDEDVAEPTKLKKPSIDRLPWRVENFDDDSL